MERCNNLSEALKFLSSASYSPGGETLRPMSGGDINAVRHISGPGLPDMVYKSNSGVGEDFFAAEACGLEELCGAVYSAGIYSLRVPQPLCLLPQGLLIEYFEPGPQKLIFARNFGEGLASLHMADYPGPELGYGFERDNYLGTSVQPNAYDESWPEFFAARRLGHQLELAARNGHVDSRLRGRVENLLKCLNELLPRRPRRSLLHGDLWAGNYLSCSDGMAALIDPAGYYGHSEADLAMTQLFGGFSRDFYAAYAAVLGKEEGYPRRREIYNLYHLLNHLNLFGGGYAGSVDACLRDVGF